ncbi:MAG TPA: hypothetical protein VM165_10540, partial [Planctomycetaceae bacterium]|nr:hypothetical protein [Planctomycetaceae bacterium]
AIVPSSSLHLTMRSARPSARAACDHPLSLNGGPTSCGQKSGLSARRKAWSAFALLRLQAPRDHYWHAGCDDQSGLDQTVGPAFDHAYGQ